MFFKQLLRNSAKNRKNNSLFFGSLVIAIIAFYTLLSLESQDVMRFLKTIESDAVDKLLLLIPAVYLVSLFFVFFLVYFACSYQMNSRRREFGLYLMLGMKRSRLFGMLMGETLINSLFSLMIGLPLSLLLTESISLATAKFVGLGIAGHRLTLSMTALYQTILGFLAVQFLTMLLICLRYSKTEPGKFLQSDAPIKQRTGSRILQTISFFIGLLLLLTAYYLGICQLHTLSPKVFLILLVCGVAGTFLLYRGLGGFIGSCLRKKQNTSTGLYTFTGRQLQENVFHEYKSLAISSLLLLLALSCIPFGISIGAMRANDSRSVDFSIKGTEADLRELLARPDVSALTGYSYPVYLNGIHDLPDDADKQGMTDALQQLPQTSLRDNILENVTDLFSYTIALSTYNNLLLSMGKDPIVLEPHQAALYTSMHDAAEFGELLSDALAQNTYVSIKNEHYELLPTLYRDNIVADRSITLYGGLILSDEDFLALASENGTMYEPLFCWNIRLPDTLVEELGLFQAIQKMESVLSVSGFTYESYLRGIGRNLFYTVAASYLTIYLGVLFLIIANTVIGLKYLILQHKSRRRYITLMMLGAEMDDICRSAKMQIQSFFLMVLSVALCSSAAAVTTLFSSFARLPAYASHTAIILWVVGLLVFFVIAELLYIQLVKRNSCRELRSLQITDRG